MSLLIQPATRAWMDIIAIVHFHMCILQAWHVVLAKASVTSGS